jgi:hypothetical protein
MAYNKTARIDVINIGLMILSCITAYFIPLELFLFSFVVLGPLHYLTEISWLERRKFFLKEKYDYLFLIALCLAIPAAHYLKFASREVFLAVAFGSAVAFSFIKTTKYKLIAVSLIIALAFLSKELPLSLILFGLLLPTLIHVFIFTGLFILYGALKNKSLVGYLSLIVFISCSIVFFFVNPSLLGVTDDAYLRAKSQLATTISFSLGNLLGFSGFGSIENIYSSDLGVALLRFVAFSYTYHYLNWFSKTSLINWHKVSRFRLTALIALWIFFVSVYAMDFRLGLIILSLLSIWHVILEFPLNYQTIWGIGNEIKTRVRSHVNSTKHSPEFHR